MDVGDIVQTRHYCVREDQTAINVRHYLVTAKAGNGATLAQLLVAMEATGLSGKYKAIINNTADYVGSEAQVIHPIVGVPTQNSQGAGHGLTAGDLMPMQICGLISLRTALGGRANRGRVYIPFATEVDNMGDGQTNAGYQVTLNALAAHFMAPFLIVGAGGNTNDFVPVIFHRKTKTTTTITNAVPSPYWATQRRRGKFGRPNPSPFPVPV